MKTKQSIEKEVAEAMAFVLDKKPIEINLNSPLSAEEGIDSIDIAHIITELEATYQTDFIVDKSKPLSGRYLINTIYKQLQQENN